MKETDAIVIFITTSSESEAHKITDILLSQRKAACVNIVSKVDSRFWWQDKIDSAQESLLIIKTKASLLTEIINQVKGAHSYTVPEVIAMPIIGGNKDYLKWIDGEVRDV